MFVDASAVVAILTREPDALVLSQRLAQGDHRVTSPIAVFEIVAAIARRFQRPASDASAMVADFLEQADIKVIAIPQAAGDLAIDAFSRFGKGQGHPAQLNMGDCLAYACARHYRVPLLFKGDDFAKTDIPAA